MIRSGVARWTMGYFTAAFASFAIAQTLVVAGAAYPAQSLFAPETLVSVHLITIGWLSVLILGALRQFVPVITATRPVGDRVAGWALAAINGGLVFMAAGFLGLGGRVPWGAMPWLPAGGALVIAGMLVDACTIAQPLWRTRPLPLPARFVAAGLAFLVITLGLGLTMALALARPDGFAPALLGQRLAHGLATHLVAGIGGWFTLTAMGVSYKLLGMFTLAPEDRGAAGEWTFRLSAGGLALVLVTGLVPKNVPALAWAGWLAAGSGLALYLADMRRLYGSRRRRELELNGRFAVWALTALAAGLVLLAIAGTLGKVGVLAGPLAYLFLFGWLSGLGLSQMYKIVPFLTWIERFGSRMGRGPVPRVQDLVDEPRARPWFIVYFAAVVGGTLAGLFGAAAAWRVCALAGLVATLAIGREVWMSRQSHEGGR